MNTIMYLRRLEDFTPDVAMDFLKEYMTNQNSNYYRLSLSCFNRIRYGILDKNMIKYVVSTGYGLYQIVAIENKNNIISVVVKYSQI